VAGGSARAVSGGGLAARPAGGRTLRVEVKLSELASPPSPAELQAVVSAVEQCLASSAPRQPERAGPGTWRFSGRWWLAASGAASTPLRRRPPRMPA
jgi:hypothetical protein